MADLANILLSFPPDHYATKPPSNSVYDRDIREYVKQLHKIPSSALVKATEASHLPEILDPSKNSIAYLYTTLSHLSVIFTTSPKNIPEETWSMLSVFCTSFDPVQVRYAGHEFCRLLESLDGLARKYNAASVPIQLLCATMLRLDPSCATFTSSHILYIRLCADARALRAALPILDKPILSFPAQPAKAVEEQPLCADHLTSSGYITENSGLSLAITRDDVQEYYILGANIYIALQQWRNALTFLEHVLVTPTQNVATGPMVEAYRKWMLVALLIEGKVPNFPKGVSNEVMRKIRSTSKAYEALSDIYKTGHLTKLRAEAEAGQGLWQDDGNTGLVRQVLQHFTEMQVVSFSRTYIALPLEDIGRHLGESPQVAEKYLASLVASGQLNATLERPSGASTASAILRFYPDRSSGPLARSEERLHADLIAQRQRIVEVADHLKDVDARLNLSQEYVDIIKAKRDKKGQEGDGGGMDLDWGVTGEDEDMMGDLR